MKVFKVCESYLAQGRNFKNFTEIEYDRYCSELRQEIQGNSLFTEILSARWKLLKGFGSNYLISFSNKRSKHLPLQNEQQQH